MFTTLRRSGEDDEKKEAADTTLDSPRVRDGAVCLRRYFSSGRSSVDLRSTCIAFVNRHHGIMLMSWVADILHAKFIYLSKSIFSIVHH